MYTFVPSFMKYLLFFFFSLFNLSASWSQGNSLLWEISGNNLQGPSYLYGTMHLADKRIFNYGDSVTIAFNSCVAYAGEVLIDKNAMKETASLIFMSGDTTLPMLVGDSGAAKVRKRVKNRLLTLSGAINKIKPIFVLAIIEDAALKHDKSASLDEYFQKQAKRKKLQLMGLETVAEQIAAVDKIPLKKQAEMLMETVNDTEQHSDSLNTALINTYLKQDIALLQQYVNEGDGQEAFTKHILVDRNYVMCDRITAMVQEQPTFIGVGAGHLAGTEGLISLLRARGFKLRSVFVKFKI